MPTNTTLVSIALKLELNLTEDELFPDGRPDVLPPGSISARDLADYLCTQLRSASDLADWGFSTRPHLYVETPEGDRAGASLGYMP